MPILTETAQLLQRRLDDEFDKLTVERMVIGLLFAGVKLSNGVDLMKCRTHTGG